MKSDFIIGVISPVHGTQFFPVLWQNGTPSLPMHPRFTPPPLPFLAVEPTHQVHPPQRDNHHGTPRRARTPPALVSCGRTVLSISSLQNFRACAQVLPLSVITARPRIVQDSTCITWSLRRTRRWLQTRMWQTHLV